MKFVYVESDTSDPPSLNWRHIGTAYFGWSQLVSTSKPLTPPPIPHQSKLSSEGIVGNGREFKRILVHHPTNMLLRSPHGLRGQWAYTCTRDQITPVLVVSINLCHCWDDMVGSLHKHLFISENSLENDLTNAIHTSYMYASCSLPYMYMFSLDLCLALHYGCFSLCIP